jgi:hypothetical protein
MKNTRLLLALIWAGAATLPAAEEWVWFDGSRSADLPPGKLLSDNSYFYGDSFLTGVEYQYETEPDNPADRDFKETARFGRRLLDGRVNDSASWSTFVGRAGPLKVTFDFKRPCQFKEVDVCTRSKKVSVRLETAQRKDGEWIVAGDWPAEKLPPALLHRIRLEKPPAARFLRVTVEAVGEPITHLDEIMAWGEPDPSDSSPERIQPLLRLTSKKSLRSFLGKPETEVAAAQFTEWQRKLGARLRTVVWSKCETWGEISTKPILPATVNAPMEIVMVRNEKECLAVALTNTSAEKDASVEVSLSPVRSATDGRPAAGMKGELRVAGMYPTRSYGVCVGPLFAADNKLPPNLMEKYLPNGRQIVGFPKVALPPAGSLIFWVTIQSDGAAPGDYAADLGCSGGSSVPIRIRVLDITLPDLRRWVCSWYGPTYTFPFQSPHRLENDVRYALSIGNSVFFGLPHKDTASEIARKQAPGKVYFTREFSDYIHKIFTNAYKPEDVPKEEEAVTKLIRGCVEEAQALGLDYPDWHIISADEPGANNIEVFGAFSRLIKKADPKVQIYCNPSFWMEVNQSTLEDEKVAPLLAPWYNECIDISCPFMGILEKHPKVFELHNAPKAVRAFYTVNSIGCKQEKAEAVQQNRLFAWLAARLGWNGWAFFGYCQPRGNPWDDSDRDGAWNFEDLPDYQVVFPGPSGPIPTRPAEALREGWEEHRLLQLLKERNPAAWQEIMKGFKSDQFSLEFKGSLDDLRRQAMEALTAKKKP